MGDDLEPIWPEKWPRERLEQRRAEIGESSFARGFRLRTLAEDDCLIKPQWVRYYDFGAGRIPRFLQALAERNQS